MQGLEAAVVANGETGQLWVARMLPASGAPISEAWRALEALHSLEELLVWLAELLLVRRGLKDGVCRVNMNCFGRGILIQASWYGLVALNRERRQCRVE